MKRLSKRMRESLQHLAAGNLVVGNYRLQERHTYVPSNTFNALFDRGLVDRYWRGSGRWNHKIAFLTDEGKECVLQLIESDFDVDAAERWAKRLETGKNAGDVDKAASWLKSTLTKMRA
jgi:hypothetical protein